MNEREVCAGTGHEPLVEGFPDEYPASAMKANEGRCPVCRGVYLLDGDGLLPSHPPRGAGFAPQA
jgi:hypothetical protein